MVYDKKSATGKVPVAVLLKNKFSKNAILALLNPEQKGKQKLNAHWI